VGVRVAPAGARVRASNCRAFPARFLAAKNTLPRKIAAEADLTELTSLIRISILSAKDAKDAKKSERTCQSDHRHGARAPLGMLPLALRSLRSSVISRLSLVGGNSPV